MLVDRSLNFWHILWNFIALDGTCMWAFSGERRAVCLVCRSVMHQGGACMWAFSRRRDWSSLQSQNDPGVFVTYWQHPLRFIEQPIKNWNRWSSVVQRLKFLCWTYIYCLPAKACRVSLHFFCFHAIAIVCFFLLLSNSSDLFLFSLIAFCSFLQLFFFPSKRHSKICYCLIIFWSMTFLDFEI